MSSQFTGLVLAALAAIVGIWGAITGLKANAKHRKTQKVTEKAVESQQATTVKVTEVQKQKEKDLASVSKDGKERVKKANEKIKDFNSKL